MLEVPEDQVATMEGSEAKPEINDAGEEITSGGSDDNDDEKQLMIKLAVFASTLSEMFVIAMEKLSNAKPSESQARILEPRVASKPGSSKFTCKCHQEICIDEQLELVLCLYLSSF